MKTRTARVKYLIQRGGPAGAFEPKDVARTDTYKLSSFCVLSIVFMNLSLAHNTVGMYQITKLACIPYMVLFQTMFMGKHFSTQTMIALSIVIIGMATAVPIIT